MHRITPIVLAVLIAPSVWADDSAKRNWPAFRGPIATGEAPQAKPPIQWSESKNIRWKAALPGGGHSTPIVWNDRVYVQIVVVTDQIRPASDDTTHGPSLTEPTEKRFLKFQVVALDRKTGAAIWTTTVNEAWSRENGQVDTTQLSNSPVTDGENIYSYFGSQGLHCLSLDGALKWSVNFGSMKINTLCEGSSPALFGDTLIIVWDHDGEDFIVAIDKHTGRQKWRKTRNERTSWATPLVLQVDGKPQVVTSAPNLIQAYDLATGTELWRSKGISENIVSTPVSARGLLYTMGSGNGAACLAIRCAEADGDITDSRAIAWKYEKDTPYTSSALLMHDRLYFVSNAMPIVTCLDVTNGKNLFAKERLKDIDSVYASIIGANGHVYVVGRFGATAVLKDGDELRVVATNKIDDEFFASPIAAGTELFLRGTKNLYCIAE